MSDKSSQNRTEKMSGRKKTELNARSILATIMTRNYGDMNTMTYLARTVVALTGVVCVLGTALVYEATRPPVMRFFSTDARGRISPLVPLDQPIMTREALFQWVTTEVIGVYTKDYVHWREQLTEDQDGFTLGGWKSFRKDFEKNFIEPVIENNYITSAVPTKAPILVDKGVRDGRYAYSIQLGITVTFRGGIHEHSSSQNYIISVLVVRQSETENETGRGLAIAQIVAQ
ncbi:DotI/IcmL/TraM family protein [Acetobacter persici]|nr:DotI/IcmL/TraM family protein [Acetobacter persici]